MYEPSKSQEAPEVSAVCGLLNSVGACRKDVGLMISNFARNATYEKEPNSRRNVVNLK
jgi:hypothetical protein